MCTRVLEWVPCGYIFINLGERMCMEKETENKVRKGKSMISLCEMEGDRRKSTGQEII